MSYYIESAYEKDEHIWLENNSNLDWLDDFYKFKKDIDEEYFNKLYNFFNNELINDNNTSQNDIEKKLSCLLININDNDISYNESIEEISKMARLGPKQICQYVFRKNDIVWICKQCQKDETCVLCNECFRNSDHKGHDVFFYHSQAGGCCDCGDENSWEKDGYCSKHGNKIDDPLIFLPNDFLQRGRYLLQLITRMILHIVRIRKYESYDYIISDTRMNQRKKDIDLSSSESKTTSSSSSENTTTSPSFNNNNNTNNNNDTITNDEVNEIYQVLLINDDVHDITEVNEALDAALPSNGPLINNEIIENTHNNGHCVIKEGNYIDCKTITLRIDEYGLNVLLQPKQFMNEINLLEKILIWLNKISGLSDSIIRMITNEFIQEFLYELMSCDLRLEKRISKKFYELFLTMMADQIFKSQFAVSYVLAYPSFMKDYILNMGPTENIQNLSVQFLNRPFYVETLTEYFNLTEEITNAMIDLFSSTVGEGWIYQIINDNIERNFDTLEFNEKYYNLENRMSAKNPTLLFRRYNPMISDLKGILIIKNDDGGVSRRFNIKVLNKWLDILSSIQLINPMKRYITHHIEFEDRDWIYAYNINISFSFVNKTICEWLNLNSSIDTIIINKVNELPEQFQSLLHENTNYSFNKNNYSKFHGNNNLNNALPPANIVIENIINYINNWHILRYNSLEVDNNIKNIKFPSFLYNNNINNNNDDLYHNEPNVFELIRENENKSIHILLHRFFSYIIRLLTYHDFHENTLYNIKDYFLLKTSNNNILSLYINLITDIITMSSEIKSGLWKRNGQPINDQLLNYVEPPFSNIFFDLDINLIQFLCIIYGSDKFCHHLFYSHHLSNLLFPSLPINLNTVLLTEQSRYILFEQYLTILIYIMTSLPLSINLNKLERGKLLIKNEIVHTLAIGPQPFSKLLTKLQIIDIINNEGQKLLEEVLNEIADIIPATSLDPEKFKLKKEYWKHYSPCYPHLSITSHQTIIEQRPKINEPEPIVCDFMPCHNFYNNIRYDIITSELNIRLIWLIFKQALIDKLNIPITTLLRCIHFLTLSYYNIKDLLEDNPKRILYLNRIFKTPNEVNLNLFKYNEIEKKKINNRISRITDKLRNVESFKNLFTSSSSSSSSNSYLIEELNNLENDYKKKEEKENENNNNNNNINDNNKENNNENNKSLPNLFDLLSLLIHFNLFDNDSNSKNWIIWLVENLGNLDKRGQIILEKELEKLNEKKRMKEEKEQKSKARMNAMMSMMKAQANAFSAAFDNFSDTDEDDDDDDNNNNENNNEKNLEISINNDNNNDNDNDKKKVMKRKRGETLLEEDTPTCILCHRNDRNEPMNFLGFLQKSNVLYGFFSSSDDKHKNENKPCYIGMCGHSVHESCYNDYTAGMYNKSLYQKHLLFDAPSGEYPCPLCKTISNCLLPHFTTFNDQSLNKFEKKLLFHDENHDLSYFFNLYNINFNINNNNNLLNNINDNILLKLEDDYDMNIIDNKDEDNNKMVEDHDNNMIEDDNDNDYDNNETNDEILIEKLTDTILDRLVKDISENSVFLYDDLNNTNSSDNLETFKKANYIISLIRSFSFTVGINDIENRSSFEKIEDESSSKGKKIILTLKILGRILKKYAIVNKDITNEITNFINILLNGLTNNLTNFDGNNSNRFFKKYFSNGLLSLDLLETFTIFLLRFILDENIYEKPENIISSIHFFTIMKIIQLLPRMNENNNNDKNNNQLISILISLSQSLDFNNEDNNINQNFNYNENFFQYIANNNNNNNNEDDEKKEEEIIKENFDINLDINNNDNEFNINDNIVSFMRCSWLITISLFPSLNNLFSLSLLKNNSLNIWLESLYFTKINDILSSNISLEYINNWKNDCLYINILSTLWPLSKPYSLINLPPWYTDFHASISSIALLDRPAICLCCGAVMEANGQNHCSKHIKNEHYGKGILFLIQDCIFILFHNSYGSYLPSIYVDEHGEKHSHFRGSPLHLDMERLEYIRHIWGSHNIPFEVIHSRQTTQKVITLNYY